MYIKVEETLDSFKIQLLATETEKKYHSKIIKILSQHHGEIAAEITSLLDLGYLPDKTIIH